jgi:glycosyltransferase involved in cell wall biosynthesis
MRPQKIIFISLVQIDSLNERGIYQDLLRQFALNGHEVTVVCPVERRTGLHTRIIRENGVSILQVRCLNVQKSLVWEKGVAMLSMNWVLQRAVKKYLSTRRFDLILYATPPITITGLIRWLKISSDAKTYLLLKDIFPQNAVDMGMLSNNSILHSYFKRKEKQLYELSDRIGCMSPGNVEYIIRHHPELTSRLEENPNSIDLTKVRQVNTNKSLVFEKWGIPADSVVYLYGGNLGKPQGTTFLVSVIEGAVSLSNAYFLIVGDGTDYPVLRQWFEDKRPHNAKLVQRLPKADFDELAACCDVGLILLRREFTIPNFPSRLLTYLENKLPVLAMTDTVTDIGAIIEREGFGKWCLYGDKEEALNQISFLTSNHQLRVHMGEIGFEYMREHYDVKIGYNKIIEFAQNTFN